MGRILQLACFILGTTEHIAACTCVWPVASTPTPRTQMDDAAAVFQGTVLDSKRLPVPRQRYEITFQINRQWKGTQGKTVALYDLSPGTDCQGFGFEVGKEYLVYAVQKFAEDFKLGEHLFYAWTDLLKPGTPMLRAMPCSYGGLISEKGVKNVLSELGPGKPPPANR